MAKFRAKPCGGQLGFLFAKLFICPTCVKEKAVTIGIFRLGYSKLFLLVLFCELTKKRTEIQAFDLKKGDCHQKFVNMLIFNVIRL